MECERAKNCAIGYAGCHTCLDYYGCPIIREKMIAELVKRHPLPWCTSYDRNTSMLIDAQGKRIVKTSPADNVICLGLGRDFKEIIADILYMMCAKELYLKKHILVRYTYEDGDEKVDTFGGSYSWCVATLAKQYAEEYTKRIGEMNESAPYVSHVVLQDEKSGSWRVEWWVKKMEMCNG